MEKGDAVVLYLRFFNENKNLTLLMTKHEDKLQSILSAILLGFSGGD